MRGCGPSAARLLIALLAGLAGATGGCRSLEPAPAVPASKDPEHPWLDPGETPAARAAALLAAMTLPEKLAMVRGTGGDCRYGGCVAANPRLGIPALRLQDGPAGVAHVGRATLLPAPVAAASTWDPRLMRRYGEVNGAEHWAMGANVVLGPTINIVRDPRWGRAFEAFSEDPYLTSQMAVAYVQGVQSAGPLAQVKHFAVYNQETDRGSPPDNAVVTERAIREVYAPAFAAAVTAGGAASVMCSYNRINGVYACEHDFLQKTLLKGELGFAGFITSDWGGTKSTVASCNNGLDQEMPGDDYYGEDLVAALKSGAVAEATLDDHVRRILTTMFRFGLFEKTPTGTVDSPATAPAGAELAKSVAEQGAVLLKNERGMLPLRAPRGSLAVIGVGGDLKPLVAGGGSAFVKATPGASPFAAIRQRAQGAVVSYAQGTVMPDGMLPLPAAAVTREGGGANGWTARYYNNIALYGDPAVTRAEDAVDRDFDGQSPVDGVSAKNWSARWTGRLHPAASGVYWFSLASDDGSRLLVDGQRVIDGWSFHSRETRLGSVHLTAGRPVAIEVDYFQGGGESNVALTWRPPDVNFFRDAVAAARAADVAVVIADVSESEGSDLDTLDLPANQNRLIKAVAAANPNTVVVLNSGSAVTMPWLASVRAVVECWYPGQAFGEALASLLFGDTNFSGRLPVSFPRSLKDVPARKPEEWPGRGGRVLYDEGLLVGYRWYDSKALAPLFPFGFGLSYTTFAYAHLAVAPADASGTVQVAFDVKNTGSRAGIETPQVYVGMPGQAHEPPKVLRGFTRVELQPGETKRVSISLEASSFAYWDGAWRQATGENAILVGASSQDILLKGRVTIR